MAKEKKKFSKRVENSLEGFGQGICTAFFGVGKGARYAAKFKKIWLAIPVVAGAIFSVIFVAAKLPRYVGINLLATGDYSFVVTREIAVMGSLAITALCLLLMFWSKRTLFPWLVSIFSLTIPYLILLINLLRV